jgi:hypothetical protein
MKAVQFITGTVAAGLAAALLAGAFWAQNATIDWDSYLISANLVSVVGAVGGALCLALAGSLIYRGARSR